MRIISPKGDTVSTMEEWSKCVRPPHWKEGRSAYSLADFILNQEGSRILEERLSRVLNDQVRFEEATPEYRAKFDSYRGNPSNLDLGIFGNVGSFSSLFVGLEAKVDEPFGDTVCARHQSAIKELGRNPRSQAVPRIKDLLSSYFRESLDPCDSRFSGIRYQLLTGTAGTVATQRGMAVFYVMVFKTNLYDEAKGLENRSDYEKFVQATNGDLLMQDGESFQAHSISLANTRLICVYDSFDVP